MLRVLDVGPKAPADLSAHLRSVADAVDRGEVTAVVIATLGKEYEFHHGGSLSKCLELATLLQWRCLERFKC